MKLPYPDTFGEAMPTRSIDVHVIRKAFDLLAPPGDFPKQYLRWKKLARLTGLGEHWIRKRYQGRDQSELEVKSIDGVRKALEARRQDSPDENVKSLIELLAAAQNYRGPRFTPRPKFLTNDVLRLRVVNVGFIRSSDANYCQRLEAGIVFGMLDGLQMTHLINDESVDLSRAATAAARLESIHELIARFETDPSYVDRTYIVPLGTVSATALSRALTADHKLRDRLGKDYRVIFAGVTEPESTGILEFSRDHIGGLFAGNTFADRLQFISEAFPDRKIAFLYDPALPQDLIARDHVLQCRNANVQVVKVATSNPTRLSATVRRKLVAGYTVVNWRIHELVRDNPRTAFIGVNVSDLGRGAILSTGNDDLRFGIDCARRLLVPDCRNEINLRDVDVIRPAPVYGINQKACNLHGLSPRIAARNRCQVVID